MTVKTIRFGIESDAIEKFSKISVYQALEELIWNATRRPSTPIVNPEDHD